MFHVRGICHVDFDGAKLSFFLDLSRRTLMQRHALKPLLEALQDAKLIYIWGFPFSLSVTKDDQQFTLLNKDGHTGLEIISGVPASILSAATVSGTPQKTQWTLWWLIPPGFAVLLFPGDNLTVCISPC